MGSGLNHSLIINYYIFVYLYVMKEPDRQGRLSLRYKIYHVCSGRRLCLPDLYLKYKEAFMMLKRRFLIILLLLILLMTISDISYGNAAEPPSIMIIVTNAPEDLEISIGEDIVYTEAKIIDKLLEKYYVFYLRETKNIINYTINVKTDNLSYEVDFEKPSNTYQNLYTLNLQSQTLTPGKSIARSILLVSMRIIITLIIEGIIFYIFGFRDRHSWILFTVINLITQGALNIWINGLFSIQSYMFIGLIVIEVLILIVEGIAMVSGINEHNKSRRLLFVLSANLLSLVVGGYVLTVLPF